MGMRPSATLFYGWALTKTEFDAIELELDVPDGGDVTWDPYGAFGVERIRGDYYLVVCEGSSSVSGHDVVRDIPRPEVPSDHDLLEALGASYPCFQAVLTSRPGSWYLTSTFF